MGIYRKGNNWVIDYRFGGRRLRQKAGSNKAMAQRALAKRQTDILEGKFFHPSKNPAIPFEKFAALYWELHGKYRRSKSYRLMLSELATSFGTIPLHRIIVPMVLEYRNKIRERASAATANRHHLRDMLNKAIEWDKFSGPNPASRVKQERENNHRLRFLSEQEVWRLLSCRHPRIYPTVACALLTGMRKGEILALRSEHADRANGIITTSIKIRQPLGYSDPIETENNPILAHTASNGLVFDLSGISPDGLPLWRSDSRKSQISD